jgi:hypothetical protein
VLRKIASSFTKLGGADQAVSGKGAHGHRRLLSRLEIAEPLAQPLTIKSKFVEKIVPTATAAELVAKPSASD